MELVKKIRLFVMMQLLLLLFMLLCLWKRDAQVLFVILCMLVEIGILFYLRRKIIMPTIKLEDILEVCIQEENESEEKLNQADSEIFFMKQIKCLVRKCSSEKSRRKSAAIFDKQAEITALQSQINPHFLYNTLESIRGQALMDDNKEIAKMVEALAAFFRYSISRKGSLVTLREELANIQNYMMIQRYRFNNRFTMEIFLDEEDECAYDFLIPKLIIQPVVENAIFHGLEEKLEGGNVSLEVIVTDKNLIITVSDNGKGMDTHILAALNERIHETGGQKAIREELLHSGIALPNIHKRIKLLFGEEYGVSVYSTLNLGTDVEITIPANYERNIG